DQSTGGLEAVIDVDIGIEGMKHLFLATRRHLEHRPYAGITGAAREGHAIDLTVTGEEQCADGIAAIVAAAKGMQNLDLAALAHPVKRAGVLSAAWGGAVKVAVEIDRNAARGKAAVIGAVEGMQHLFLPMRCDLEHRALVECAAFERGAVEIAV